MDNVSIGKIFVPDSLPVKDAIERTTHMGIGAHQDDLEIMAVHGILECFGKFDQWFMGVCVGDGSGSSRDGLYKDYSNDEMKGIRVFEQQKAAYIGEYGAMAFLGYQSNVLKDANQPAPTESLKELFALAKPKVIYTHNLADKHDTHVAVTLRVIAALRLLADEYKPEKFYACECWRDLDWMPDDDKVVLDISDRVNLSASLIGVFDSQIAGGKRYDVAALARRTAHATFFESHETDTATQINFAMDMMPLLDDVNLNPSEFIAKQIQNFADDVTSRIEKVTAI